MGSANKEPLVVRAKKARNPICGVGVMAEFIRVGSELRKRALGADGHIGIDQEQMRSDPAGEFERLVAVVAKIDPFATVQFSGNLGKRTLDFFNGVVG